MATRTANEGKATKMAPKGGKQKATSAPAKSGSKPHGPSAKAGKASKPTKAAKGSKAGTAAKSSASAKAAATGHARGNPPAAKGSTPAKPSWTERFWHAVTGKAQTLEVVAHVHTLERDEQRKREAAAEKAREAAAAAAAKQAAHEAAVAERRKTEKSKRELVRIAKEEAEQLKEVKHQAKLAQAREKRAAEALAKKAAEESKRLAEQEKAEQARLAAAEAERLKAEKAEAARLERVAAKEAAKEKSRLEADEAERVKAEKAERARAEKAEADRREKEEVEAQKQAKAKEAAKPKPAAKPAAQTPADHQADRLAEELASRRSKPIVIAAEDEAPLPTLPGVGRNRPPREEGELSVQATLVTPAPPAKMVDAAPRGLSLPESFILLALEGEWNERSEHAAKGAFGGGLAGALVLELALRGRMHVQRDRLVLIGSPLPDDGLEAVARALSASQDTPSLRAMMALAKSNRELLTAFKNRLKDRGYVDHAQWKHLGAFHRSQMVLTDPDAQERLRGKLRRAIAGGGTPDAPTILALGLLDAAGLFETVVPAGAVDYNRKRLNGLLAGRDVMGYAVDKELKGLQEIAVRTVLANVRQMS